jgi:hypothetical protein
MTHDNERVFAERLANVFLQESKVRVKAGKGNIAFCDVVKKQIFFDFDDIFPAHSSNDKIFQQMMVFKGLNFHEILHLKFTPKKRGFTADSIFYRLLGQLEDGRIETLGVMLHEKLADYFICAVNEILIKDKKPIIENKDHWLIYAYILCYGRSIYFQDLKLLAQMRTMIIKVYGRDTADLIEETINKFIPEKSFDVRVQYAQVLFNHLRGKGIVPKYDPNKAIDVFVDTGKDETDRNTDKDLKEIAQDFPELSKALDKIAKELQQQTKEVKDDSKAMDKAKQEKAQKLADLSKERQEVYKAVYDEKDGNKRDKLRKKVDDLTQKIKETESGTGYSPDGMDEDQKELKDLINDKKDEQEKLVEAHKDDLTSDLKSIGHEIEEVFSDSSFNVTQEMRTVARELEKNLSKMNNELASGYQPKNRSGRINVRSLLNRKNELDVKIFNRYQPDKLKLTKAQVNIYIDGSGSMSSEWDKAVRTMWIINEALNRDDNKIMIYQFSHQFERVKEYDQPLTVPRMMGGGTNPAPAINNSIPIIEAYRKSKNFNFIVDVIITDGEFSDTEDEAIMKLNALGHETILIKVGYYAGDLSKTHKAKHIIGLKEWSGLVGALTNTFIDIKKGLVARTRMM